MKRTISILLSLVLALGACLSVAAASFAAPAQKFTLPGKIREQAGRIVSNTTLSYDKKSKTLTAVAEDEAAQGLYAYLFNQSTDVVSNRFLDRNDIAANAADYFFHDLFSSDLVRLGAVKKLVIKQKDAGQIDLIAQYTFTAKNGRLVSAIAESTDDAAEKARTETKYEYNRTGTIAKIIKRSKTKDDETQAEVKYAYDVGGRLSGFEVTFKDIRYPKDSYTGKAVFSQFQSGCPTQAAVESDGDKFTQKYSAWKFDDKGRVTEYGNTRYTYDATGRLTGAFNPTGWTGDPYTVQYSAFFTV